MIHIVLLVGLILNPFVARAEESPRPDESSLFGGPSTPVAPSSTPAHDPPDHDDAKELQTSGSTRDAFATGEVTDNPLQMGGTFYQRAMGSIEKGVDLGDTPISAPLQFDGFMDARPNDRIRGFVDGRLLYDPTRDSNGNPTAGTSYGSFQTSSTSAAPTTLFGGSTTGTGNPTVVLDQAWLKFDIDRAVFITAGKQHVKWGTSRFWNPTDFLNTQKRDPLLPYDLRLGNFMVKFEVPLAAKGTNLYAIALVDNPQASSVLGQLGAAFRAETLLGDSEVGAEAAFRNGHAPTFGADVSSPLGPFDIYAEGACLMGATTTYGLPSNIPAGSDLSSIITTSGMSGPIFQISAGVNYSFAWEDNRQATVGVEYFYNEAGYSDAHAYPALIFTGAYLPFYTGKNYAAIYLTAEGPDAEKHTSYTFSTLANLSDMSFISRIDFSWRFLTYLTFESYVDVHYGTEGGEFNFSLNTPTLTYQGTTIAALNIPPTYGDIGIALRVSF
jgi:hypothetical protein